MIELFCTFLILSFIIIAKRQTKVLARLYDRNNVGSNDYTMFLRFTNEQRDEFEKNIYDRTRQDSSRG